MRSSATRSSSCSTWSDELVPADDARADYGVVIDEAPGVVDDEATGALRERLRAEGSAR